MSKPDPDRTQKPRTQKPSREQRGLVDPHEVEPKHGGPGHEDDGGESLLSGRSREDDADEIDNVGLPPKPGHPE